MQLRNPFKTDFQFAVQIVFNSDQNKTINQQFFVHRLPKHMKMSKARNQLSRGPRPQNILRIIVCLRIVAPFLFQNRRIFVLTD